MEHPPPTAVSANPLAVVGKPIPEQEGRTRELFANTKVSLDALSVRRPMPQWLPQTNGVANRLLLRVFMVKLFISLLSMAQLDPRR